MMAIKTEIKNLMMATTKDRTILNFYQRHYCNTHMQVVDKHHFTECKYLTKHGSPDQYVPLLRDFSLTHLSKEKLDIVVDYYQWLHQQIENQLSNDNWVLRKYENKYAEKKKPLIQKSSLTPISAPSPSVLACLNECESNSITS
jgi:hypothetical protein